MMHWSIFDLDNIPLREEAAVAAFIDGESTVLCD